MNQKGAAVRPAGQGELAREVLRRLLQAVADGERRKILSWVAIATGVAFVAGYYLSLDVGFTPSLDLGQATLLFVEAFLVGVLFLVYLGAAMFSPAYVFHFHGAAPGAGLARHARRQLLLRNLAAQVLGVALFLLGAIVAHDWTIAPQWRPDFYLASFAADACIVILAFCRPLKAGGFAESRGDYAVSILLAMLFAALSFFIVWTMSDGRGSAAPGERWMLYLAWLLAAFFSALFSATPIKRLGMAVPIALSLLFIVFAGLNSGGMPVRVIASAIGIAEKDMVTLVLPPQTCESVSQAMSTDHALDCDDRSGGVLRDVWLRNQLGDRWILQEERNSRSIVFDGRGVTVQASRPRRRPAPG